VHRLVRRSAPPPFLIPPGHSLFAEPQPFRKGARGCHHSQFGPVRRTAVGVASDWSEARSVTHARSLSGAGRGDPRRVAVTGGDKRNRRAVRLTSADHLRRRPRYRSAADQRDGAFGRCIGLLSGGGPPRLDRCRKRMSSRPLPLEGDWTSIGSCVHRVRLESGVPRRRPPRPGRRPNSRAPASPPEGKPGPTRLRPPSDRTTSRDHRLLLDHDHRRHGVSDQVSLLVVTRWWPDSRFPRGPVPAVSVHLTRATPVTRIRLSVTTSEKPRRVDTTH